MTRRLPILAATLALLAVACGAPSTPALDYGSGTRFVPTVADTIDDVGQGAAVAVTADGLAYVSYLGFPADVEQGDIPVQRPVGSAFLPALLLTSVSADDLVTKGAVQQTKPSAEPPGVLTPFRPQTVADLDLTQGNTDGSAIAVGGDGVVHVAWTAGSIVNYGRVTGTADAEVTPVFDYGSAITQAGPIGRPAIALDADGNPWVAFGVSEPDGSFVEEVATLAGTKWTVMDVATIPRCDDCSTPLPSGIAAVGDAGLVVVFVDPSTGTVNAATPLSGDGKEWTVTQVDPAGDASGLSLTASGDTAAASYYADGAVHVATLSGGWSVAEVAKAKAPADSTGLDAATTGIAIAQDGTEWVAWQDGADVHLASGDGSTFEAVDTPGTVGGSGPSLAIGADGTVYLAWFDTSQADLMLGYYGDVTGLAVANPSPAPTPSIQPAVGCGDDKKIQLAISAANQAFDPVCLVAPAGEAFDIEFSNEDTPGNDHNIAIFTDPSATTNLFRGEVINPGTSTTYHVEAQDPADYFFHCDVHPFMTGVVAVVKGAK